MVSVTRRGRVAAYAMSPQVLEDYLDGHLAMQAEKGGFGITRRNGRVSQHHPQPW